jgi:hypothetical protein
MTTSMRREDAPRRVAHPGLRVSLFAAALLATACAEMPVGPTVAVMPGPNKPFDVFAQDDGLCRNWAAHSIGVPGHDATAQQMLSSMAAGAVIGAVAGGLIGGDRGAGAGAAMGTVVGASTGANQGAYTAVNAQRRYDIAYQQCMHARGNLVSGAGYSAYGWAPPAAVPAPPPPPPPAQR